MTFTYEILAKEAAILNEINVVFNNLIQQFKDLETENIAPKDKFLKGLERSYFIEKTDVLFDQILELWAKKDLAIITAHYKYNKSFAYTYCFKEMTILEALRKYFQIVKEARTISEIKRGLLEGGFNNREFLRDNLRSTLRYHSTKKKPEFVSYNIFNKRDKLWCLK